MNDSQKRVVFSATSCEVRFDAHTRRLYATDASLYQIEPFAVAFPRSQEQVVDLVLAAQETGVPLIARGAGTGLAGGAVGSGVIVNLAQYNRRITDLNRDRATVRVEPGVVLDQLNAFLRPHGFCFGPDVATSSRATLGGMIGNNSSGARSPLYGTTADNIVSLEVVFADGTTGVIGNSDSCLDDIQSKVATILQQLPKGYEKRFPLTSVKRMAGYGLDRYVRNGFNLTDLICGSEGTLAVVTGATLSIRPLPREKGLALLFFDSVTDALSACVELNDLDPIAVEHIDRALFDQTRGQLAFRSARELLRLDEEPCEAILIVEFYDDAEGKVRDAANRNLGRRSLCVTDPREMEMVWSLRKAGLSLLTGRKGDSKPVPGLEDVAVLPRQLPDFARAVKDMMARLRLEGSFYGHAGAGLLHIRPIINCRNSDDIARYRKLAEEVFAFATELRASIAGEHGVGIARTEFMEMHLGKVLCNAMCEVKRVFDPNNLLNPGKIVPLAEYPYRIDTHWRMGAGYSLNVPFEPVLRYRSKDESFVANLEQCNGCGACLKGEPTMCPTFVATREEVMSTRGRANTVRAVLEGNLAQPWTASEALKLALTNCLSCKACTTECPSNVNMTLLKADLLHAAQKANGLTLREIMVSHVDWLGRLGRLAPRFANAVLRQRWVRRLMHKHLGFAKQRPFPAFARESFQRWLRKHVVHKNAGMRGEVVLWDDTFVRYFEPQVGIAAVTVLEAAGFRVRMLTKRKCCGRPAFSVGRLDKARDMGCHNIALLLREAGDLPIIFLEPSCFSMFAEDYAELGIDGADEVSKRCYLFEEFVADLLTREPSVLRFREQGELSAAIHAHCHVKALRDPKTAERLLRLIPGGQAQYLDTGCCGMAGQFGQLREKYDLSVRIARPLVEKVERLSDETPVVACGISCRHQISHLTTRKPVHIAELLAQWLAPTDGTSH